MGSVLDENIVLRLNSCWMRLGFCTPRQALVALCGGIAGGSLPAAGLDIDVDEDGNLVKAETVLWNDWINLPVRDRDIPLGTKNGSIRCPSVIVFREYSGMPMRGRKLSGSSLRERDGGICQVSGRALAVGEGNMGHIKARAKGGARSWENLVYMDKKLNSLQGTKTPDEMGWKLLNEPRRPKPIPACAVEAQPKSPDHAPFINS